jgi:cyanophycin synthetase
MAALGADVVEIAHKSEYLRGRPAAELGALIREGAAGAGVDISREHDSELPCLVSLVAQSKPGDVVAMMTHQDRAQVDDWLTSHGGTRDNPATLQTKAQTAQ